MLPGPTQRFQEPLTCAQNYGEIQNNNTQSRNHNHNFQTFTESTVGRLGENNWVSFIYLGAAIRTSLPQQKGCKIHIGINDAIEGNLARAWELLLPVFKNNRIASGKIIRAGRNLALHPEQCAKQITIYCFKQGSVQEHMTYWQQVFTEITRVLRENNIVPAPIPDPVDEEDEDALAVRDHQIQDSEYISHRDDQRPGQWPFDGQIMVNVPGQAMQRVSRAEFMANSAQTNQVNALGLGNN